MATKRKANPRGSDAELDPFAQQVEQAMEHVSEPNWLGMHSPLAAPYFLGQAFDVALEGDDVVQRGQALQRVLTQAVASLDGEPRALLELVYLKRDLDLGNVALAMKLNVSERTFYRLRLKAIQTLAQALSQTILPALRAQIPAQRSMVGREAALKAAIDVLLAGGSVYISGPSGIGKTMMGVAIAHDWLALPLDGLSANQTTSPRAIFWYTFRGLFNDYVASFLFALGYFLRGLGAAYTWRQLVADRGVLDLERSLGILRYDLDNLQNPIPLICIDDIDTLQDEISEHVQIVHLLEELSTLCPVLFMGQRVILKADEHIHLTGFGGHDFDALLRHIHAPELTSDQCQQLLTYTRGNPALIVLFNALIRAGEDRVQTLQALVQAPSLEGMFSRLWRRLAEDERDLMMQQAVFRNPSPDDVWKEQRDALDHLLDRELIQRAGQGSIQLLPHLHKLAYDRIPAELKPALHVRAASIREEHAEYVAAMHHAIECRQSAWAVWLWFSHRKHQIDHGQGSVALELLRRISASDLSDDHDRTALHIARAELLQLAGKPEEAEQELKATTTSSQSSSRAFVRRLEGHMLDAQGRIEQALQKYRESLDALTGLPQYHAVVTHRRLSFLHLYRMHNVDQARKEAFLARAKADEWLGDIESMAGRYNVAIEYLLSAKANVEEQGGDLATLSVIYSHLGVIYIKLGEFEAAIDYFNQAINCDRKRGDEVSPIYDVMNRATAYTLAGQYEQGYQDAQGGLKIAEKFRYPYLIAGLSACVAEACYGLQKFDEAEHYAGYSLSQEEEFFRASTLLILGKLRLLQGEHDQAITLLTTACDNAQQIEDSYTEDDIWRWLGVAHEKQSSFDEARTAYEVALRIYTELNLPKDVSDIQRRIQEMP